MMAQWSLDGLLERVDQIDTPVHLITGLNDTAVPPRVGQEIVTKLPHGRLTELPNLGHLAHEEDPKSIAQLIRST
jgi:magnesium chelatase accessory protein